MGSHQRGGCDGRRIGQRRPVGSCRRDEERQGREAPHPDAEAEGHQQDVEGDDARPPHAGRRPAAQEQQPQHHLAGGECQEPGVGLGHDQVAPRGGDEGPEGAVGERQVRLRVCRDDAGVEAAHDEEEAAEDVTRGRRAARALDGRGQARAALDRGAHEATRLPASSLHARGAGRQGRGAAAAGTKVLRPLTVRVRGDAWRDSRDGVGAVRQSYYRRGCAFAGCTGDAWKGHPAPRPYPQWAQEP
ncbi:hypothetical protein NOCA150317 [metagenome]|uniref:Uncharacterized protein n=1 Tax=metagenome TaxID=256318 RepID=A0A2P2CJ89_9ZZZZ